MNTVDTPRGRNSVLVPLLTGAVASIAASRTSELLPTFGAIAVGLGVVIFFAGAMWSASRTDIPRWVSVVGFLGGTAVGVLIDVVVDWVVFSKDRNLFPFEIIWWWFIGAIPIIVGVFSGYLMRRGQL